MAPVRYFFSLVNSHEVIPDEEGIELADARAAVVTAYKTIEELRSEDPSEAHEWPGWKLEITDASGRLVASIPLDVPKYQ